MKRHYTPCCGVEVAHPEDKPEHEPECENAECRDCGVNCIWRDGRCSRCWKDNDDGAQEDAGYARQEMARERGER
jgi:hypothetical protein